MELELRLGHGGHMKSQPDEAHANVLDRHVFVLELARLLLRAREHADREGLLRCLRRKGADRVFDKAMRRPVHHKRRDHEREPR